MISFGSRGDGDEGASLWRDGDVVGGGECYFPEVYI